MLIIIIYGTETRLLLFLFSAFIEHMLGFGISLGGRDGIVVVGALEQLISTTREKIIYFHFGHHYFHKMNKSQSTI